MIDGSRGKGGGRESRRCFFRVIYVRVRTRVYRAEMIPFGGGWMEGKNDDGDDDDEAGLIDRAVSVYIFVRCALYACMDIALSHSEMVRKVVVYRGNMRMAYSCGALRYIGERGMNALVRF